MPRCVLFATLACLWLAGCSGGSSTSQQAPPTAANEEWFDEYAAEAGIDFVHFNGMSGQLYYPEIMGPGVRPSGRIRHGDLEQRLGGGRGWRRLAGGADHHEQQDAAAADHLPVPCLRVVQRSTG